ncbi:MAG: hypothetical protein EAZ91_25290 [Cytophagales bacterium]|nr:MAG: hypothetical protein EAZ91_25290 [Cytophagales bacterium]
MPPAYYTETSCYWPFFIRPRQNELLSSFLVRTAHAHGVAANQFFQFSGANVPIKFTDPDIEITPSLLDSIVNRASLDSAQVYAMTYGTEVTQIS